MFFVQISSILPIPIMLIGINGGYFPAICRVCLYIVFFKFLLSFFSLFCFLCFIKKVLLINVGICNLKLKIFICSQTKFVSIILRLWSFLCDFSLGCLFDLKNGINRQRQEDIKHMLDQNLSRLSARHDD